MAALQSLHSLSLLIVEDDKAACDIIARMVGLQFPEYAVYTAYNGVQGLELFKEHAPDIVITDVNMPVMDGIELARKIRLIDANATYIVLTAYSNAVVFEQFQDIGVCAYLLKPIDFEELFAAYLKASSANRGMRFSRSIMVFSSSFFTTLSLGNAFRVSIAHCTDGSQKPYIAQL